MLLQICFFFAFFQLFNTKSAENDYFDKRMGCAAPKRWSKYTTNILALRELWIVSRGRQ